MVREAPRQVERQMHLMLAWGDGAVERGGATGDVVEMRLQLPLASRGGLGAVHLDLKGELETHLDRKSTRLNSSHSQISYAVFCLKKKKNKKTIHLPGMC